MLITTTTTTTTTTNPPPHPFYILEEYKTSTSRRFRRYKTYPDRKSPPRSTCPRAPSPSAPGRSLWYPITLPRRRTRKKASDARSKDSRKANL